MNIKKLLITEVERKRILQMHGLLKEDDPKAPTTVPEVKNYVYFDAGFHSQRYLGNKLEKPLKTIKDYLTNSSGKTFIATVFVSGSESKIPNTDAESGNSPLKPGELALKRSKTIESYITEQLKGFVDSKALLTLPKITVSEPKEGKTAWVGQPFCPADKLSGEDKTVGRDCLNPKFNPGTDPEGKQITNWSKGKTTVYSSTSQLYQKEQFIYVYIKLKELPGDTMKCMTNMEINVDYLDTSKGHVCNSSTYMISINDIYLKTEDGKNYASLDNAKGKFDNQPNSGCLDGGDATSPKCVRKNKFIINNTIIEKIVADENFSTKWGSRLHLQAVCYSSVKGQHSGGCHEGVPDVSVKTGTGAQIVLKIAKDKMPLKYKSYNTIAIIDPCGKQIK
jgi:hypothetical protein